MVQLIISFHDGMMASVIMMESGFSFWTLSFLIGELEGCVMFLVLFALYFSATL